MKPYPRGLLCGDGKGIRLDHVQLPALLSDNFKVEVEVTPTNKSINDASGQMFLTLTTGTYIRIVQNNFHFRISTLVNDVLTSTSSQITQVTVQNNVRYKVSLEVSAGVVVFTINGSNGDSYVQKITLAAGTSIVTTPWYSLGMWSSSSDRREFYGVLHNVKFYNGGNRVLSYDMESGTMPGPLLTNYGSYIVPKSATPVPKKNLVKPISNWNTIASEMVVLSPYKAEMNVSQASRFSMVNIDVKPNTTYTVKANHNGRLGVYKNGTIALRAYGTEQTFTFNSGIYDQVSLYFNNAVPGYFFIENVMVYEGLDDVPFEPYELGMKKPALVPKKNLIPDFSKWTLNAKATIVNTYELLLSPTLAWSASNVVIDVKPNTTYTFSREFASGIVYLTELDSNGNQVKSSNTSNSGIVLTLTTMPSTAKIKVIYDNGNTSSGSFSLTKPQLKEGSVATPFKPYELGTKPAILYPKKNLVDLSKFTVRPGTTYVRNTGNNSIEWDANADYAGADHTFPDGLLNGRTITYSKESVNDGVEVVFIYYISGEFTYFKILPDETSKTITVPVNANNCRLFVQNRAGVRGVMKTSKLQLEKGSLATSYEPYQTGMKPL